MVTFYVVERSFFLRSQETADPHLVGRLDSSAELVGTDGVYMILSVTRNNKASLVGKLIRISDEHIEKYMRRSANQSYSSSLLHEYTQKVEAARK